MPHVSVLPISTPQVTDTKVVNLQGSKNPSDADSTFSDLVEQHYLEDNGGKEARNDGHSKNNPNATERNVDKRNNSEGVSADQKIAANSESNASNEKDDVSAEDTTRFEQNAIIEQILVAETKETKEKNQKINQDITLQLLSFITSSDKILSKIEQTNGRLGAQDQIMEEKNLATLINSDILTTKNLAGDLSANVIAADNIAGRDEPISEKLTAEQLSVRLAMLKDNQPLTAGDVELTASELELLDENAADIIGKTPVNLKAVSIATATNQAQDQSIKQATDSELNTEILSGEEDQVISSGELDTIKGTVNDTVIGVVKDNVKYLEEGAVKYTIEEKVKYSINDTVKGTTEQEFSDKKITNKNTNVTDKKEGDNLVHLSAQFSDELRSDKGVIEDKGSDKSINVAAGLSVNAMSDKAVLLNESTQGNPRTVNQSTASFMEQNNTGDQNKNAQNPQKDVTNEELSIAIDEIEQNIVGVKKQAIVANSEKMNINPVAESVIPRAILPESEGIRASQHFESIMSNMTSELSQSQKSAVALQSETIAVYKKDFTNAVKDKVMIMINQKIQQIEIQLDPAELGSMSIRVNLQNEQAVVSFMVQNQQAKEAVEENIDKLKSMLAESGIDVGDANIEQQDQQSADNEEQNTQNKKSSHNGNEDDLEQNLAINPAKLVKASSSGVDYYA